MAPLQPARMTQHSVSVDSRNYIPGGRAMHNEKLLPQDIDAEIGVLGSLIIDPEAITLIADTLHADDFYREVHRTIYTAMLHLYEHRTPADYITLCDKLQGIDAPVDGWEVYLDHLTDSVPTSAHVEHYARIVVKMAEYRRLIHGAGRIAAIAYEEEENALEQAERIIFDVSQRRGIGDFEALSSVLSEYLNDLDTMHEHRGQIVGVPTGLYALDGHVGGLQQADLIIEAGRPGQGKASLALTIAHNAALTYHKRVGIFSLE